MANGGITAQHLRLFKPLVRAYSLGFLSSTCPKVLQVLIILWKRKTNVSTACQHLLEILRQAIRLNRFPTFCGVLVGGSTLLQIPLRALLTLSLRAIVPERQKGDRLFIRKLARIIASFVSANLAFRLLNAGETRSSSRRSTMVRPDSSPTGTFSEPPEMPLLPFQHESPQLSTQSERALAGRTMDLTLFVVFRALDVLVNDDWKRKGSSSRPGLRAVSRSTPPVLFCLSAAIIMHSWFYSPSRLPSSYNSWISTAAGLDHRLLLALRHARYGTFVYGKDTGLAPLLGSMCKDYDLPEDWGNPAKTIPVPCELVHMDCGKSCEKHALVRFCRGWIFAARMYAPLQLFVLLRNVYPSARPESKKQISVAMLRKSFVEIARNSAFLGAFISLFYYGVCLSRTRVGPRVFPRKTVSPQMWDGGLCVLAGCVFCGASILVEKRRKQLEILFFVLPRAAATLFPRRYLAEHRWKEQLAFATSATIVLSTAQESPEKIRGIVGSLMQTILSTH